MGSERAMSISSDWEHYLGTQIRKVRIQKQMTQAELASRSGISVAALASLENGKGSTLKTFVAVLLVLDKQMWLSSIAPKVSISPMQMLEHGKEPQRVRARKGNKNVSDS